MLLQIDGHSKAIKCDSISWEEVQLPEDWKVDIQPTLVSEIKPSQLHIQGTPNSSTQFLVSSKKHVQPPPIPCSQSVRERSLRIRDCMHQDHFIQNDKIYCMHCNRVLGDGASSSQNPPPLPFNGFFDEPPSKISLGDKEVFMTPYVFPSDSSRPLDVHYRQLNYLSKAVKIVDSHTTAHLVTLEESQAQVLGILAQQRQLLAQILDAFSSSSPFVHPPPVRPFSFPGGVKPSAPTPPSPSPSQ